MDAREGGPNVVAHRKATGRQDLDDGVPEALDLALSFSFSTDIFQAGVALALQQIPEDHLARCIAVIEGLHRHRIGEDPRCLELLPRMRDLHLLARLVHLDPPWAYQTHDPDVTGAGGEELSDLGSQVPFVLAGVGIFDGQRRRTTHPARLVGDLAHSEIRGSKGLRGRGNTNIDANILDRRIAGEHGTPDACRPGSPPARRQAVDEMSIGQLVWVTGPNLVGTERSPGLRLRRAFGHSSDSTLLRRLRQEVCASSRYCGKSLGSLALRAANELEPFRYRLRGDRVLVHDRIHAGTTALIDGERFAFCYFEYDDDFARFAERAQAALESLRASGGRLEPREERDDLIHCSVLPWISFTSFSNARRGDSQDSVPKIVFGRYFAEGDRFKMPVSVEVHHALMDGLHVGRYFERLESSFARPEALLGLAEEAV